jgi:hypothetical protein
VVVAEDPAPPLQHVVLEAQGLRVLAEVEQVAGELAGGGEGVRMLLAEHPAAPDQRGFVECAGPPVPAEVPQVQREVAGREDGVGVIVAQLVAPDEVGALVRCQCGLRLTLGEQVGRGAVEEPGRLGGDHVEGRRVRGCGQDMREQPSPQWPPARVDADVAGRGAVEQPDHRGRPHGARGGVRLPATGAQQRRRDPVHLDVVGGHRGHASPLQDGSAAGQYEGIRPDRLQPVGEDVGMIDEQAQRHRLGPAPRHQRQHVQRRGFVRGEPVEGHRPRRRQRLRVDPDRVLGQHLLGPFGQ